MQPNPSAEIALFLCEGALDALQPSARTDRDLARRHVLVEMAYRFPGATADDFVRGCDIAKEVLEADRRFAAEVDAINNPCRCGKPGWVVSIVSEHDATPTGERWCIECDLAEAAKTPCACCGGPMDGGDVRAGLTACEVCDPEGGAS